MTVKWNGVTSSERKLNGGGPQGATFGLWEYLAQSNNSADCVDPKHRFKFVDDLTILEKVNLLLVGLASHNCHSSVPSDIPVHNQIIPGEHLKSQEYLQKIKEWTEQQKMVLNYKFTTRIALYEKNLEIVDEATLLGVMITDDLKWDKNTE